LLPRERGVPKRAGTPPFKAPERAIKMKFVLRFAIAQRFVGLDLVREVGHNPGLP